MIFGALELDASQGLRVHLKCYETLLTRKRIPSKTCIKIKGPLFVINVTNTLPIVSSIFFTIYHSSKHSTEGMQFPSQPVSHCCSILKTQRHIALSLHRHSNNTMYTITNTHMCYGKRPPHLLTRPDFSINHNFHWIIIIVDQVYRVRWSEMHKQYVIMI